MAADLVEAVVAFANAHPTLTDSTAFGDTSWLWLGLAPQDQPLPHATLTAESSTPAYHSKDQGGGLGSVTEATFTLSVYSSTRANCRRLADLVRSTLTDAPLVFSGGELLQLRPGATSIDLDPDPGPDGGDVWAASTVFNAIISTP